MRTRPRIRIYSYSKHPRKSLPSGGMTSAKTWRSLRSRALSLIAVALAATGCGGADATPRHIVLVSIDTLRADHLGCYRNEVVRTPHIDRLAEDAVLFERHVSSAPSPLNSHTSLMTGTYGHTQCGEQRLPGV